MTEQAFPFTPNSDGRGTPGMLLRDYFAAAALTGPMATIVAAKIKSGEGMSWAEIAQSSYQLADAMMKERERA